MEDFLYILAVLGWVAYSFFKNSKKVKEKRPTISRPPADEQEQRRQYPEVRDILRELMGEEEEVRVPAHAVPVQSMESTEPTGEAFPYEPRREQFSWDAMYYQDRQDSWAADLAAAEVKKYRTKNLLAKEQKRQAIARFDLRTAVIMSEILRRPYDESRLSGGYAGGERFGG
ncbi:MAG: hypothetical protein IH599_09075 [Bacteroidales bacterium]|nr:hypothetical protein [Bacteroidales bacterium]